MIKQKSVNRPANKIPDFRYFPAPDNSLPLENNGHLLSVSALALAAGVAPLKNVT